MSTFYALITPAPERVCIEQLLLRGQSFLGSLEYSPPAAGTRNPPPAWIPTASAKKLPSGENYLAVSGGQIWYKMSGQGTGTPVILLHGGPGFTSVYMKSLEAIGTDRKVVRYDQLGSGNSSKATDTAMFNVPHFVAELERIIAKREAEKNFEAPDYQAALMEFYGKYVFLRPVKADLDSLFAAANLGIYNYMQGPSEFTITGTLKKYDTTPYLKNVKVPTLYLVGEVDEANPATVKRHAGMTPGANYAVIPNSAHIITWDNPTETNRLVKDFLKRVDSK